MADLHTIMTNLPNPLTDDSLTTHTHADLCDPCASNFIKRDEPVTLSVIHDTEHAKTIFLCTICRSPAKRWTVETANHG